MQENRTMAKVTVQHEGKAIEVELEGYVPVAEVEANYVAKSKLDLIVKDEKAKAKRSAIASALSDQDFKAKALTEWGIDLTKGGAGEKLSDQQLAAAKQDWETKALKPLQDQLQAKDAGTSKLQRKILQKSILAAAAAFNVKKELRETLPGGREPAIVSMLEPAFGLHDEDADFYVRKGPDGFEPSTNPDRLFANIDDYFGGLAKDKNYAHFFDRPQQSVGAGAARSAVSSEPGVVANDPITFGNNIEGIAKGTVVVAGTGA
jgi:hypothetical protein